MKYILRILIFVLIFIDAKGAFVQINNLSGTTSYGTLACTVTSSGCVTTWSSWCTTSYGTSYWADNGCGLGSYTFTLNHPVYSLKVYSYALNGGPFGGAEYTQVFINGAFHPLTAAEMTNYNDCPGFGSGPCYLSGGLCYGPVGTTSDYNGGDFIITQCSGITSFELQCSGPSNGATYYVFVDTTFGGCWGANNNGPVCFGDSLKLKAVGGDSTLPYSWHGPGGYTSTVRNPVIVPASFADSGWFYVVQTIAGVNDTAWTHVVVNNCMTATNNGPICWGDTLRLHAVGGDSLIPYNWYVAGGGLLATGKNPVIINANYTDSGMVCVVQSIGGSNDTVWTHVVVKPKPVVTATSNSPLCSGAGDTLLLYSGVYITGETFSWTGPNLFSSTLQNPFINTFIPALDTGTYRVIVNLNGCKDTATTHVVTALPPAAPGISGITDYCIGAVPTPFTLSGVIPGATILWYTTSTGGTGSLLTPTILTSSVGCTTYWVTQSAPCESPRDSITVCIHPNPATPTLTANPVCADSTLKLMSNDITTGILYSWSGPLSFSSSLINPTVSNAQVGNSGAYILTVTDTIYHCHSSATINAIVNPTPSMPELTADSPCNHGVLNLTAAGSGTGSLYCWSGPSAYTITSSNPIISPAEMGINDGVYTVVAYIGVCPSVPDTIRTIIHPIPSAPTVFDTSYCQKETSIGLNATADSGGTIRWYTTSIGGVGTTTPPVPQTNIVGTTTWYVNQTSYWGCVSPRTPETATILYLPVPAITLNHPFACQDSTLLLSYSGVAMNQPGYTWTLPWYLHGTSIVNGTLHDSSILVRFDSTFDNTVYLHATDYNGRCAHDTSLYIKIVPKPRTNLYIYPIACVGDTVRVALTTRDTSAYSFNWNFDNGTIITANSNSGGPYDVRWSDDGYKVITVQPETIEGCLGIIMRDTLTIRNSPYTEFHIENRTRLDTIICAEDSLEFVADMGDSTNYKYEWSPTHFFHQNNKGKIWGRLEVSDDVTLRITDQFGCANETNHHYEPESCCNINFPTAFSPNGDGRNDRFRPIAAGYHRFHIFRIQNRWGQTVYETTNSDGAWDGTYGGIPQEIGVYFYYLKIDCGDKTIEKRGDFTLVR